MVEGTWESLMEDWQYYKDWAEEEVEALKEMYGDVILEEER